MKRGIIVGLLAITLTLSGVFGLNGIVINVQAKKVVTEITNKKIALKNPSLVNGWNKNTELIAGEEVFGSALAVDAKGEKLEYKKDWAFVTESEIADSGLEVQFYSQYADEKKASKDSDRVEFDDEIPEEAFGKYIYKWVAVVLLDESGEKTDNAAYKLIRSENKVTDWGDTDYQTFALNNDGKTVKVFSIYNAENSFDADIQKKVKIGEKKYKVTGIGDYALENAGGTGMESITIPSGIKSIGKQAFKGAKNLKTINIQGNLKTVGKNAFKGINEKALFNIKASGSKYKKTVKLIKKSGVADTVTFNAVS
ncbi:MAG: leucine-rich repeat domain-containing protein [Lachnospiraceae bacterium]|nr:leucine-rich repeat domain-containing protein [Lachnospiraceae bacterium]